MTSTPYIELVILPTLKWMGVPYDSHRALLMLCAIGLVESRFKTRLQEPIAHAHGFWQFERGGGCAEFATSPKLGAFRDMSRKLGFPNSATHLWNAIGMGADHLACIMARAVLWLDPAELPARGDVDGAYVYYLRRWRPGKSDRARWNAAYAQAMIDTEEYL